MEIIERCEKRFGIDYNPVWKEHVAMYLRSAQRCRNREKGWHSQSGTSKAICNAVDRNITVDLQGKARCCFDHGWSAMRLEKRDDLEAFWLNRQSHRDAMLHCNRFCGISHSLKAESCTLSGNRKAEWFIEKNLGAPEANVEMKGLLKLRHDAPGTLQCGPPCNGFQTLEPIFLWR